MYDLFSQVFLALFLAAYLVLLAALARSALGGRFRSAMKKTIVPASAGVRKHGLFWGSAVAREKEPSPGKPPETVTVHLLRVAAERAGN